MSRATELSNARARAHTHTTDTHADIQTYSHQCNQPQHAHSFTQAANQNQQSIQAANQNAPAYDSPEMKRSLLAYSGNSVVNKFVKNLYFGVNWQQSCKLDFKWEDGFSLSTVTQTQRENRSSRYVHNGRQYVTCNNNNNRNSCHATRIGLVSENSV